VGVWGGLKYFSEPFFVSPARAGWIMELGGQAGLSRGLEGGGRSWVGTGYIIFVFLHLFVPEAAGAVYRQTDGQTDGQTDARGDGYTAYGNHKSQ